MDRWIYWYGCGLTVSSLLMCFTVALAVVVCSSARVAPPHVWPLPEFQPQSPLANNVYWNSTSVSFSGVKSDSVMHWKKEIFFEIHWKKKNNHAAKEWKTHLMSHSRFSLLPWTFHLFYILSYAAAMFICIIPVQYKQTNHSELHGAVFKS